MQDNEVRHWIARPADYALDFTALAVTLDEGELARCRRFLFDADRNAYALAHALRRRVLAELLAVSPETLSFSADDAGKPVQAQAAACGFYFSHSTHRAAIAFAVTRAAPVGIDVEAIDPRVVDADVLDRHYAPGKRIDAPADFFDHWCSLEAFWKAQGRGLHENNPRIRLAPSGSKRRAVFLQDDASPAAMCWRLETEAGLCARVALMKQPAWQPQAIRVAQMPLPAIRGIEPLPGSGTSLPARARSAHVPLFLEAQ